MFVKLAKATSRYKIPILVIWVALAIGLFIFAPPLSKVGVIDQSQFLPQDTQSAQAQEILKEKFSTTEGPTGSASLVIYNPNGLSTQDIQEAQNLHDWLLSKNAPSVITGTVSIFDNPGLRSTLVSQDQTTMLMQINLSTLSTSASAKQAVSSIRSHIQDQHPDPAMYVTGNAGISDDLLTSIQNTIDKATWVTVVLVIVLLLIIYRSPVAMFVPLITIGISYLVSRGLVGYLAASGVKISSLADAYLVVTIFGIGTDYCLFIVSRYKEELVHNGRKEAGELAIRRIGPVILASATTVIVALLCLGISRFGMNRTSGFALAVGVAVTLLAGLTLTPALISLFGKNLLWPARFQPGRSESMGLWDRIGRAITSYPAAFAVPIVLILAIPYIALPGLNRSADMLSQMPKTMESVQGFNILRAHFPAGELAPTTILVKSNNNLLADPSSLKEISSIGESVKGVKNISRVDYFSAPSSQILSLSQQSRAVGDAAGAGNVSQLNFFQTLGQSLQALPVQYLGIQQSSNFQQAAANLKQMSAVAAQLQTTAASNLPTLLGQIKQLAYSTGDNLKGLSDEFTLSTDSQFTRWLQATYFSKDGTTTKLSAILNQDPYATESTGTITQIRTVIDNSLNSSSLKGAAYYVGGETAVQADVTAVNDSDFGRVIGLAIVGILIVSILLLRSVVAPFYMILTVLFNFGATLGISTWLFLNLLNQKTMDYVLPLFIFIILVAVGSDYNIFLVSRIREENGKRPLKEAIRTAVANTGGVITACGIILAGTFGTLMTASLQLVFQVGGAIAIGVLIDTFLVRAMLIPSLASLAGRWNWWPSRLQLQNSNQNKSETVSRFPEAINK